MFARPRASNSSIPMSRLSGRRAQAPPDLTPTEAQMHITNRRLCGPIRLSISVDPQNAGSSRLKVEDADLACPPGLTVLKSGSRTRDSAKFSPPPKADIRACSFPETIDPETHHKHRAPHEFRRTTRPPPWSPLQVRTSSRTPPLLRRPLLHHSALPLRRLRPASPGVVDGRRHDGHHRLRHRTAKRPSINTRRQRSRPASSSQQDCSQAACRPKEALRCAVFGSQMGHDVPPVT